jgi:hypothetical protein
MEDRVAERYIIRPADRGFRILDVGTGQTAVIAQTPQTDLSEEDAARTAKMHNDRAAQGERPALGQGPMLDVK